MTVFFKAPDESHVNEFGYDRHKKLLTIKFKYGDYTYAGVPAKIFEDLVNSTSKGKFINANIKGKFEFKKV